MLSIEVTERRAVAGRPPATLVWVERHEGLDRLMLQPPPFNSAAEQLFATGHRFAGLDWLDNTDSALLNEYLPGQRLTRYESAPTPPNYYLVDRVANSRMQLTHDIHPAPALQRVKQIPLRYTRGNA